MSVGMHTIELAAFIVDGGVLESTRSGTLHVIRIPPAATASPQPAPSARARTSTTVVTRDGLRLQVRRIADGLANPVDLAVMQDGRVLVAEEAGRVRVVTPDGALLPDPALVLGRDPSLPVKLQSIAVAPDGSVFLVYVERFGRAAAALSVVRFREAANALYGPTVLIDRVPATSRAAAVLRVATDGKVVAALDDGGTPAASGDFGSLTGKILRLNPDGTTPADQAGATPVYLADVHSPGGFDWQPDSNVLWLADRLSDRIATLSAVTAGADPTRKRGERVAAFTLPPGAQPSSAVFYKGDLIPGFKNNLFIASDQGAHLLRIRFDAAGTRIVLTERLLQGMLGGIRAVAAGPAGAMYLATRDTLAALLPQ
jgi:glucose/arabinose dehydrogenase